MNIGQLAASAGVNAKTIRYYEESGLLPPARRGSNGIECTANATCRF